MLVANVASLSGYFYVPLASLVGHVLSKEFVQSNVHNFFLIVKNSHVLKT